MARAYRARKAARRSMTFLVAHGRALRGTAGPEDLALLAASRRCARCGYFIGGRRRADAVYCSRSCKAKAYRARRAARPG
ncbi:hypothetical protein [Nonomuraea rhodomycinica]|uniref:CGNR zinc finger domain-containing protein n=1 Tax=Nonomuraea rhodomycinica TaxID=1712872 RepID=A0A7Y6IYY2_9ACTN|nr:hypothetical protein [Nonomuraea rhodomycinica]NUW47009.1 hypothetical protein [Nonomuraea rhodomycinica]